MTVKNANTAVPNATALQGDDPNCPNNLLYYHVSLGLIEKLVKSGRLSQADFNKSLRVLSKKYSIPRDSIFAETA